MEDELIIDTNIPVTLYATNIEEFNNFVKEYDKLSQNDIILTSGKNIAQESLRHMPCSLTWKRANHFEYHYIDADTHVRAQYAIRYEDTDSDMSDTSLSFDAKNYFNKMFPGKKFFSVIPTDSVERDVNMFTCPENYHSQYYNYVNEAYTNEFLENTYSLDRNSAFLASMLEVYPETKPWVDKYYADKLAGNEKIKPYDKIVIGWLKNPSMHRTHAWKRIINNSNRKIHQLRKQIEANGNTVLLVNTDAIKYIGEFNYETSKDLGGFKYEWKDSKMYIKGVKSYAYVDNNENKWKFKQAGECRLDLIKPRSTWTIQDFVNGSTTKVKHIRKLEDSNLLGEFYE